ncbi:MAG: hypothetical protein WCP21_05320, partial [Armatimonadota bacterium]
TGIRNLVAQGQEPVGDIFMARIDLDHLPDIIECWASPGVRAFELWMPGNAGNDGVEGILPFAKFREPIETSFQRSRDLGVKLHVRNLGHCLLPGLEDHILDPRDEPIRIVRPGSPSVGEPVEVPDRVYPEPCDRCVRARGVCPGVDTAYLGNFGASELAPYKS